MGSRHLWALTLDQGWGPEVDQIQPSHGEQVWKRREIHALEQLALSLEWLFQRASIARADPSMHRRGN